MKTMLDPFTQKVKSSETRSDERSEVFLKNKEEEEKKEEKNIANTLHFAPGHGKRLAQEYVATHVL
jgi:hypothetical protein